MNDIQITIDTPIFHNIDDIQSTLNEVPERIMIPGIHIYYAVFTSLERLTIVICRRHSNILCCFYRQCKKLCWI